MDTTQLITFLIGVGVWAQTELSEIWKLRRQNEQQKPPIELNDKATMEVEGPAELEASGVDFTQGERAKQLVDTMQEIIYEWLLELQEIDIAEQNGRITATVARRQKQEVQAKIETKVQEIPQVLQRLGIQIERK